MPGANVPRDESDLYTAGESEGSYYSGSYSYDSYSYDEESSFGPATQATSWQHVKTRRFANWTTAEETEYRGSLARSHGLQLADVAVECVIPACISIDGPTPASGDYDLVLVGSPPQPRQWGSAPVWNLRGFGALHRERERWVISAAPGRGPGRLCSVDEDASLPTMSRGWQANQGGFWTVVPGVVVAPHPSSSVWLQVTLPPSAVASPLPRRWPTERTRPRASMGARAARRPQQIDAGGAHLGAPVFCRDDDSQDWRVGAIAGFTPDGRPLVVSFSSPLVERAGTATRPQTWEGKRVWKQIRPMAPPEAQQPVVGGVYAMPDSTGHWFGVEVAETKGDTVAVVVADGTSQRVWKDVPARSLFPANCLEHEVARWRGKALSAMAPAPPWPPLGVAPPRPGDRVEVRDHSDEEWLPGVVGRDGLVVPDKWDVRGQGYRWRRLRRPPDGEPVPGARRALIVACDYLGQSVQLGGACSAAFALEAMLKRTQWDAPVRLLVEKPGAMYPTYANISAGIRWLCDDAGPGDSLFFAFIGRTAQPVQAEGSGVTVAGLAPCDLLRSGPIMCTDLLRRAPPSARLTLLLDAYPASDALVELSQRLTGTLEGGVVLNAVEGATPRRADLTVLTAVTTPEESDKPEATTAGALAAAFAGVAHRERSGLKVLHALRSRLVKLLGTSAPLPQLSSSAFYTDSTKLSYGAGGVVPALIKDPIYFGVRPRWYPDPPPPGLMPDVVEVRGAGLLRVNGRYELSGASTQWARRRWVGTDGCTGCTLYWDDGCWWLGPGVYGKEDHYRSCDTESPLPPLPSAHWQACGRKGGTPPYVELRYTWSRAAPRAAAAVESPARLRSPVWCPDTGHEWPAGTEVAAAPHFDGRWTVRLPDNTTAAGVSESRLEAATARETWSVGDVVAVRDRNSESWIIAKVVAPGGAEGPRVRPSGHAVHWGSEEGYLFKQVERVRVGLRWEAKDGAGRWWPVTVLRENDDETFLCEVHDGTALRKEWPRVLAGNLRRPAGAEHSVLRDEVAGWREPSLSGSESSEEPPEVSGVGRFAAGDTVQVRDNCDEDWLRGEVISVDEVSSRPLVRPVGWQDRGPFMWREVRSVERDDSPAQEPPQPAAARNWPKWVPRKLLVRCPLHCNHCPARLVSFVRFVPVRKRDAGVEAVSVGCLELYSDTERGIVATPLSALQEGGRVVKGGAGQGAARCAAFAHNRQWWCSVGGNLVIVLREPCDLRGYRLMTGGGPVGGDPIEWVLEVSQSSDPEHVQWRLWEECAMEVPRERFAWTQLISVPLPRNLPPFCSGTHVSKMCAAMREATGVYELVGTTADAVHARPVWRKADSSLHLFMTSTGTWIVGDSPFTGSESGMLRSTQAQRLPHQQECWESVGVRGSKYDWGTDPEIEVKEGTEEVLEEYEDERQQEMFQPAAAAINIAAAVMCIAQEAQRLERERLEQEQKRQEEEKKKKKKPKEGSPKGEGKKKKKDGAESPPKKKVGADGAESPPKKKKPKKPADGGAAAK